MGKIAKSVANDLFQMDLVSNMPEYAMEKKVIKTTQKENDENYAILSETKEFGMAFLYIYIHMHKYSKIY